MVLVVFSDLDGSLFSSHRGWTNAAVSRPAAVLRNGEVCSMMSQTQEFVFNLFSVSGKLVPVTARSREAFSRVLIPFEDVAVLSHGAVILNRFREVDEVWHSQVLEANIPIRGMLKDFISELSDKFESHKLKAWVVNENGIEAYGVIKSQNTETKLIHELKDGEIREWVEKSGQHRIHCNGRQLMIVPNGVSKGAAVNYLIAKMRKQFPSSVFFGLGDSNSDLEFLRFCDYTMIPAYSQLQIALNSII